jgi:hypothetical protein
VASDKLPAVVEPVITQIANVKLEDWERVCYRREYEPAGQAMLTSLRRLKVGAEFIGYAPNTDIKPILYTRFCAAVTALLLDPGFQISQDGFDHLASEHAIMDLLWRASAFRNSDFMLAQVSSQTDPENPASITILDGPGLAKFLLTYSLRSGFMLNFEQTFRKSPQSTFSLWAGMISPLLTVAKQAHERRELLLGMHEIFADVTLTDAILPTLSDAYMYTSYGSRRDKHAAKRTVHLLMASMLAKRGVVIPPLSAEVLRVVERPTIVLCLEWWTSLHAMYRCYAPIVQQLRSKFRLVAFSQAAAIDEVGKQSFDEWHEVPADKLVFGDLMNRIAAIKPDIIYYPSLGMAMWWVMMASIRLAPIQMMTLGHPASSHSPVMDYLLCDEGAIGDHSLVTEKVVEYPNGSARFIARPDAQWPQPLVDDAPNTVHIAIPAMLCKISAPFVETLQRIASAAKTPVVFHFFVNMLGVNLYVAARELREYLPTALIYQRDAYSSYLANLAKCHAHFSPWPFGGTNSNIDSMQLGLPILTLLGDEPHERFDALMVRRAQLPEWLVTHSVDEYVAAGVRLIDNHAERNQIRDHLRSFDLVGEFFGEHPEHRTAFVDTVWRVYLEHPRAENEI